MSKKRSYSIAVLLGLAGLALNLISAPILTEETPEFLFGGAPVFLAFLWLGYGPGLLAGVVSLAVLMAQGDAAGLATAVYLVEAVGAYWIYLRVRSLVFATGVFWFTAGVVLDALVYWWMVGLQADYVVLLFVKQVFNGSLNAILAEGISLGFRLESGAHPMPLRSYLFRRVAYAAALPALVLALVLTRTVYSARLDLADSQSQRTAREAEARLAELLRERHEDIGRLARVVEIRWRLEGPGPVGLIGALPEQDDLRLVGLADADGIVVESSPARDSGGRELRGLDLSDRGYFQEARRTLRTVYSPVLRGRARLRQTASPELVVVIAEPLFDEQSRFLGVLNTGLELSRFPEMLARERSSPDEILTLVDGEGTVVASLDPDLPAGSSGARWYPEELLSGEGPERVSYYPPPRDTLESRLALDLRHATVRRVMPSGWRLVVERPAESLYGEVVPFALSALALFPALILLLYAFAQRFLRRISDPLVVLHDEASRVRSGEEAASTPRLASLSQSAVAEVRSLGVQFAQMLEAVNARSRAAARALEVSETKLEQLLSAAQAVVWSAESDRLRLTFVSPQAELLLGFPQRVWLEEGFWDRHLHPEDLEWVSAARRAAIAERGSCQLEFRMTAADGRTVWVRDVLSVQSTGTGREEVIGVLFDVTENKRLEEQLREADRIESLGRLAGGVAHDFNNLLTAINGYADLLLERLDEDSADARDAREIRRAGQRAATLTGQLLAFGRRQVLRPVVLELNEVVDEIAGMLRRVIGSKIAFETDLSADLSSIRADRGMIEQVLVNLVVNARDAMPEGGTVVVRTANVSFAKPPPAGAPEVESPHVLLEVRDSGHGMDEATRAQIFDPFFTTKEEGKGTGLGLSTVYGIVQQSGGTVSCESAPGAGSTFRVYLPAVEPSRRHCPVSADASGAQ